MKPQAVVVADDPVYLSWLQLAAEGVEFSLVRPLDAEDLMDRVQKLGRVDIVFFQFEAANAVERAGMVEKFLDRMPDVPLAGLGADNNAEVMLAAMRAGARDFFVLRRDDANVAALLGKLLRRSTQAQSSPGARSQQGKLFAVLSCNPTERIAFTAEHLALACAGLIPKNERALLVDIAGPPGAAAIFLNLNLAYSVLDAVNDVYRADQTLVDTAFTKHVSGIYVLSLPEDLVGRPQVSIDELLKLLQVLRGLFGCIVVALDGTLPLAGITGIIAQADRTLLLTDQSIIKSRHNKYLLRALRLEDCILDRTGLVVDGYRRRLGLEPKNLAEILDLKLLATLSGEGDARIQAMNAGEPMFAIAPKDSYCDDVRRLAAALLAGESQIAPARQGLLGKLFS
jgi:pilus assembly protein CpaE